MRVEATSKTPNKHRKNLPLYDSNHARVKKISGKVIISNRFLLSQPYVLIYVLGYRAAIEKRNIDF